MTTVCISGYYGFDNVGDEAILLSIINELKKEFPDIEISVLSNKPEKTAEAYGVKAYDRWKWWQIHKAIIGADILISGGGGLLQDITGKKSLLYYTHVMKMALRRKRPVFIFSQGIGPISSSWGQNHATNALRKTTKITVRDEESAKMLHSWGLRKGRIKVTADPVLTMGEVERQWDVERFIDILKNVNIPTQNDNDETEIEICIVDEKSFHNILADNASKIENEAAKEGMHKTMNAQVFVDSKENLSDETMEVAVIVPEKAITGDDSSVCDELTNKAEEAVIEAVHSEEQSEAVEESQQVIDLEDYGIMGLHPSLWKKEDTKLAIFAIRDWDNLPEADIAKVADLTAEAGYTVVFLPFQYPNDVEISKKIVGLMTEEAEVFDAKTPLSPQEILAVMDESDFVFGMRLHSLIMAAITKTPFASLSYNPKVESFVNQLGLTATSNLKGYQSEVFLNNFQGVLASVDEVKDTIEENIEELTEKAESVMDQLHTLLDRISRRNVRKNGPSQKESTDKKKSANDESQELEEQEQSDTSEKNILEDVELSVNQVEESTKVTDEVTPENK